MDSCSVLCSPMHIHFSLCVSPCPILFFFLTTTTRVTKTTPNHSSSPGQELALPLLDKYLANFARVSCQSMMRTIYLACAPVLEQHMPYGKVEHIQSNVFSSAWWHMVDPAQVIWPSAILSPSRSCKHIHRTHACVQWLPNAKLSLKYKEFTIRSSLARSSTLLLDQLYRSFTYQNKIETIIYSEFFWALHLMINWN